ncbi:MAG TPA: hypothetical protein VFR18_01560 [Terriglobia bacterium]|nr:hypothetical protein [Terriglobia bacterium]
MDGTPGVAAADDRPAALPLQVRPVTAPVNADTRGGARGGNVQQ